MNNDDAADKNKTEPPQQARSPRYDRVVTVDDSSDMEGGGSKGKPASFIKSSARLSPVPKDDNDRESSSIGSKSKSKS